jgi:hypothetical protein
MRLASRGDGGMSHAAAKKIIALILKHAAEQDQILWKIRAHCTESEFSEYKRMIGASMGTMLLDVVHPIIDKYPDLKPARLKRTTG